MPSPRVPPATEPPGFAARRIAADILETVLVRHRPLDEQLDGAGAHPGLGALADRDRALVRALVSLVLRRLGTLRHLLGQHLERGFPAEAPRVETALLLGAAQILWLDVPNHAAVDLAVRLVGDNRPAARFSGLANAVLRRIAQHGAQRLSDLDTVTLDTPAWLMERWTRAYGAETARAIAEANGREPALDLTVKSDPDHWASVLGGRVLPTGTVRAVVRGPVPQLPGYNDGTWWVQDAAAALPARLLCNALGDARDKMIADLCAAPGGKTAQLALAGARVTAVDRVESRLARLRQNLVRLGLSAETVAADASEWHAEPFDAVLLDAPCSSTGTIRRHPDIPWLKHEADIVALAALQGRLLAHAAELTKPGGILVYSTCSLEPEESEGVVDDLLGRDPRLVRRPIEAAEVGGLDAMVTKAGDLRSLPHHLPDSDPQFSGIDGFFAARIERR